MGRRKIGPERADDELDSVPELEEDEKAGRRRGGGASGKEYVRVTWGADAVRRGISGSGPPAKLELRRKARSIAGDDCEQMVAIIGENLGIYAGVRGT